ncbi:hypothetical protein CIB48_g11903 [Xylaria polymorpha]|nr:hypothetical protein CIB48_g11903 [Xylaria polymorpha]
MKEVLTMESTQRRECRDHGIRGIQRDVLDEELLVDGPWMAMPIPILDSQFGVAQPGPTDAAKSSKPRLPSGFDLGHWLVPWGGGNIATSHSSGASASSGAIDI